MTQQHPIIPPPKLLHTLCEAKLTWLEKLEHAYQLGADQELEACCEWLGQKVLLQHQSDVVPALRAARRPKPQSLKEQALEALDRMWTGGSTKGDWELFRRALEALPE